MKRFQQGLTLIELMIVVPIMGILAAVAPPAFALYDDRKTQSYEMPDFIFSLYDRRTQNYFCHATRVSKDFLLTAAHCFYDGYKYLVDAKNIILGSFSGEQVSIYPGLVREVILHPKYSEKERTTKELELKKKADPSFRIPGGGFALANPFDLALIKVDSSQLPDVKEYPDLFSDQDFMKLFKPKRVDEILVYSHYRHLSKLDDKKRNLEKMVMSLRAPGDVVIFDYQGQSWLSASFKNLPDQYICKGDSGSGAFIKNEATQNKITLVGVTSRGRSINEDDSYACLERTSFAPISYENTTWIESVMRK